MRFTKYEKQGDYHWDLFFKLTDYQSHAIKVQSWVKEESVLDVGAGDGLITYLLKQAGKRTLGIDPEPRAVELAQSHGSPVEPGTAYNLQKYYEAGFASVFMGDSLEHLERPEKALEEAKKVAPVLYVTTPPRKKHLSPYHYQEWTKDELKQFLESVGWNNTELSIAHHRIYGKFVTL